MSRSSAIAVLGAFALTLSAPAQDREEVLATIRNLEASIGRLDDYIRGLRSARTEAPEEEIARLREALDAEMRGYATRAEVAETELAQARAENARIRQKLDETVAGQATLERDAAGLTERTENAVAALAAASDNLEKVRADNTRLQQRLDETIARLTNLERETTGLRQRTEDAEAALASASDSLDRARTDNARLQERLDESLAHQAALERRADALRQRAEDAEAELAAARDLQLEQRSLQQREPVTEQDPDPSAPVQIPLREGGIQIHIHGGEVTFQVGANALEMVMPQREGGEPRDTSNLHLRFRQDREGPTGETTPPGTTRRIHLP